MNKKNSKYLIFICFSFFILANITNAAGVSSKLHFCEYPGTLRALKIVGIAIIILKIAAPLILTYSGIASLLKVVISGKQEDLTGSAVQLFKKTLAGLVIFIVPSLINYAFDTFVDANNDEFTPCITCIFDTSNCEIPTEDPDISMGTDDE